MNGGDAPYRRNQKWLLLLLLPLCYALFFHELGARDIWDPDEDEYVLVNREMVRDGHWLYPTANGGPYGIKPPLFNWLGSAISLVHGEVTEFTSRLPSAAAATLGLLVLYFLGRMLFGYRAAWISVLVLATSPLYVEFGRWIQINMISTVLLTATMACFTWGYTNERRRTPAYLLMYAATGLGTLDMGPVNAVMPTIVIGAYLIVVKDLRHLWQMRIGWGLLVYLAIVAPWYTAASLQGGYAENLLIVTNLTRFFGEFHHSRPFYYYVQTAPAYFLPWLVFLPGALYLCFAERTRDDRSRLLLPFVWVVGLFLFFSMSNTKRSEYILPIFPALALLVGYALDWALLQWEDTLVRRRFFTWPLYVALGLGALAAPIGAIYAATLSMDWLAIVLPISVLVLIGCAISLLLIRRERGVQSIVTLVILVAAVVAYASGPLVAKWNQEKSAKPFCLQINEYLGPGETLKTYRFYKAMYGVYSERFVEVATDHEKLARWFASEEPVYVVTEEEDYLEVKESFPLPIHVVLRASVDGKAMLLISNRAPGASEGVLEKDSSGYPRGLAASEVLDQTKQVAVRGRSVKDILWSAGTESRDPVTIVGHLHHLVNLGDPILASRTAYRSEGCLAVSSSASIRQDSSRVVDADLADLLRRHTDGLE
jgi:4-amino-4-deoxy-L-arabinose transferase-like glycosyltransferase